MLGENFRPWGEIKWILSKYPNIKWDILGSISTEDRCLGLLGFLGNGDINNLKFIQINDPPSKSTLLIQSKIQKNENLFFQKGRKSSEIERHELLEPHSAIVNSIAEFTDKSSGNIIFDISSLPKRFFFPMLKVLLTKKIKNLIIVYSTPIKYCPDELSANPDPWEHLPLFGPVNYPEPPIDVAIVGIGFMPFTLPKLLLGRYSTIPVKFLFPFPPGPPNYQRTWEFVREIEQTFTFKNNDSLIRINSNNVSDAYEYIFQESIEGQKSMVFAPYGPKPISLAMCLYAIKYNSPVYYTQPRYYNPNYSVGIKKSYGYPIILNNNLLY